jgi:hypothetical protein
MRWDHGRHGEHARHAAEAFESTLCVTDWSHSNVQMIPGLTESAPGQCGKTHGEDHLAILRYCGQHCYIMATAPKKRRVDAEPDNSEQELGESKVCE